MYGLPLSDLWLRIQFPTLLLLSTVGLASPREGVILLPNDALRMQQSIPGSAVVEAEDTNHYDILCSTPEVTVEATRNFLAKL